MRFTHVLLCSACISLVACASKSFPPSDKHIQQSSVAPATTGDIPQPSKRPVTLPPPKPAAKIETYSVVVTNVSAREILFALARDAKINIDIGPGIEGVVTLNAIDQTLPQILDRISKQVDMRYTMENGNLFVEADKPYLKTYKIDFINMSRTVSSKIFTSSQIGGSASGTASGGNTASTAISSDTKNDLMNSLVDNVKAILADEDRIRYTERIERRNELAASARGMGSASENSSNPSASNTNSGKGQSGKSGDGVSGKGNEDVASQSSTVQQNAKYEPAVNVNANKETGVLLVRATGRQHAKIQEFIDKVMNTARRQVLIEATIAEVTLSDNYQQGIDWSALAAGAKGFSFTQSGTNGLPTSTNTPKMMVLKYANPTSKFGDLSSSVSLLDSFGDVKVLSSPKLSVMNNQTATLKVVDNKVYFTITSQITPATTISNAIVNYTTTAVPVAVGFTMNVTPEINDADYVTINVRPTITRIIGYVNDPNPNLAYPCANNTSATTCNITPIVNKVPEIRTREMESIIRISSGQVAVLGGLMQDEINNLTDSVPLLGEIPIAGNLFKSRNDTKTKTELVIFLRPVVIKDASLEGDFSAYRNNLPDANYLKPESEKPKP
jgi:general secretion pathway protein D